MSIPSTPERAPSPITGPLPIDCTFTKDALSRFAHMTPKEQTQFITELLKQLMANTQSMPEDERNNCAKNLIQALNTDDIPTDSKISISMWRTALFSALTQAQLTEPSKKAFIATLDKVPAENALEVQEKLATAAGLGITTVSPKAFSALILSTFVSGLIVMTGLAGLNDTINKKTACALSLPIVGIVHAGPSTTYRVTLAATTKLQKIYDKTKNWYQSTLATRNAVKKHVKKYQNYYLVGTVVAGIGIGLLYLRYNSPALAKSADLPSTTDALPLLLNGEAGAAIPSSTDVPAPAPTIVSVEQLAELPLPEAAPSPDIVSGEKPPELPLPQAPKEEETLKFEGGQ